MFKMKKMIYFHKEHSEIAISVDTITADAA